MVPQKAADAVNSPWNINSINACFWDPHMILMMLKWLRHRSDYEHESVISCMRNLYKRTVLIDDYTSMIGEPVPPKMVNHASRMKAEFVSIESKISGFLSCMITVGRERQDTDGLNKMERKTISEWSAYMSSRQTLSQSNITGKKETDRSNEPATNHYNYPENILELLLRYCYLFYASGEYNLSKRWLLFYLDHVCEFTVEGRERTDLRLKCLWGLMASSLLCLPSVTVTGSDSQAEGYNDTANDFDQANTSQDTDTDNMYIIPRSILVIEDHLEPIQKNRKVVLVEKLWLIHWSIWSLTRYYFPRLLSPNESSSTTQAPTHMPFHIEWTRLLDWLFSDQTLCLISTFCPHLLRYIAIIAILNRQRQDHFKATVDIISRTSPKFRDPFTSIIESLCINFDFEDAQAKLALFEKTAVSDFLLTSLQHQIEEHARLLIFQTYCRIQKSININVIAEKLDMTAETAERWIVNLIRNARLEAKIDSENNRVNIASPTSNVYQDILDKTRNLIVRSSILLQNIDKPGTSTFTPSVARNDFYKRPTLRMNNSNTEHRGPLRDIGIPVSTGRKT